TNATIYKSWNERLEEATLIIREGKVESIGQGIPVPEGAVIIDLAGKTVYPSFIDMYAAYGMPEVKRSSEGGGRMFGGPTQYLSSKDGPYSWNMALKPEFRADEVFAPDDKKAAAWRREGFGTVLSHRMDGIARGSSVLVTLSDERPHKTVVRERAANHLSFSKGTSPMPYPRSLMGIISLLRQTYYDAQWYKQQGHNQETNLSLEAWNNNLALPQIIETGNKLEVLRAAKLGAEFGITYIIKGSGDEYQRLNEIKATGSPLILPLHFPDAYDVEDPFDALNTGLAEMKHWELAPSNPARVAAAGIPFTLTRHGLAKGNSFLANLRKAIQYGLSEADALKALTYTPARLTNSLDQLGSLHPGKLANFIITDGNIFDEKTKIYHNWVMGKPFVIKPIEQSAIQQGRYMLTIADMAQTLEVKRNKDKYDMRIVVNDSTKIKVNNKVKKGRITLSFKPRGTDRTTRLSGTIEGNKWAGKGQEGNGNWTDWTCIRTGDLPPGNKKKKKGNSKKEDQNPAADLGPVTYPFTAYGWTERPRPQTFLLKNATVWTCDDAGVLENTDVLIRNGKIEKIGKNLRAAGATVVDATGRHITPGIIDEHSHIAASRGINEGSSQFSSAEVRIGDVVNSEDINIYRQLSGGVTTSQILHGSSNPIGGQSAIIKLRWGFAPEEMKYEKAVPFIKFALGENVKRSWSPSSDRFPATRMGVAQVYEDHFTEAKKYGELKRSGQPYRKDLELEALLEILEGKRFITCHSYRQSEINMLMKVAERFGFRVNTFTHILEGYKVADKMAAHGAGGSSFSDWWAYKFEVYEAIPHNGAMMHQQGVTVAFNSDDAEMARRLNQEAAKAVRFGGISEEEALRFVTINPAKLLHIDAYTGSLKEGKDADVVLWSGHPLSIYSKADMTFVDGIRFFDRREDLQKRKEIAAGRNRLIQKMLAVKKNGGKTQRPTRHKEFLYHCDSMEDEGN
ncbi:MAG TPA: amidohydrolase, partial [Bacteroidetes bacterium]|nr:amidohydrolase [Bacteroidota bacterium]